MYESDVEHRTLDLPFYPVDDISYLKDDPGKTGIRCVVIIPNGYVKTTYIKRTFFSIGEALSVTDECRLSDLYSQSVEYRSGNEQKELTIIYTSYGDEKRKSCCIEYDGTPLIYGNSAIITGPDFTDLSLNECYALVMSARAKRKNNDTFVCVNIKENMDMMPRLISDEE